MRDCRLTHLIRGNIHLPKVEHPKFEGHEGHVMPNEHEYQNPV